MTLPVRRAVVIVVVIAVVVVMTVVDGSVGRGAPASFTTSPLVSGTSVVPAGLGTSSWFCTGGSGAGAGAEATVVMVNPTGNEVYGTLTAIPSTGKSRTVSVTVAPGAMTSIVPAHVAPGPWLAASVELDRSGIGVDETVSSPLGWSEAPCASSTANHWYFPDGSTAGDNGAVLSIFNPGVTEAVVDTDLVTAGQQVLKPAAYQGVTVGAGSVVTEYVSDHDAADAAFAASVVAVTGSVVASELQSFAPTADHGLSLLLGAPSTSTTWSFPETEVVGHSQVDFRLYDPLSRPARVSMDVGFTGGSSSPMVIDVPAGRTATVDAAQQARLPVGVSYQVHFVSTNGIGVVVSRSVTAPAGGGAPQVGMSLGVAEASTQWLLPSITAPGSTPWSFAVEDLAGRPVSVTISGVSSASVPSPASIGPFTVEPSTPRVFGETPPPPIGTVPVIVSASGPIAVELDPEPVGTPGVVVLPALPMG